jgi:hypothetical protein
MTPTSTHTLPWCQPEAIEDRLAALRVSEERGEAQRRVAAAEMLRSTRGNQTIRGGVALPRELTERYLRESQQ